MAELTYSRRELFASGSGGGSDVSVSVTKRTLIRTGSTLPQNTTVTFNSPGAGWVALGASITFSGTAGFLSSDQIYHNGQLIHLGEDDAADCDAYYVSDTSCAFEFPVVKNDVIQFWHFTTASG